MTNGVINVKMSIIVDFNNINNEEIKQNKEPAEKKTKHMEEFAEPEHSVAQLNITLKADPFDFRVLSVRTSKNCSVSLQSRHENAYKNKTKMINTQVADNTTLKSTPGAELEELNVSLSSATNYLIQLFYSVNQIYSCTRTKIGKLLSIASFIYASRNQKLFDEDIYDYNGCGTTIIALESLYYNRDIYIPIVNSDSNEFFPLSPFSIQKSNIPFRYQEAVLPIEISNTLYDVFLHFCGFTADRLGELINYVLEESHSRSIPGGKIDLSKFANLPNNIATPSQPLDESYLLYYIQTYVS